MIFAQSSFSIRAEKWKHPIKHVLFTDWCNHVQEIAFNETLTKCKRAFHSTREWKRGEKKEREIINNYCYIYNIPDDFEWLVWKERNDPHHVDVFLIIAFQWWASIRQLFIDSLRFLSSSLSHTLMMFFLSLLRSYWDKTRSFKWCRECAGIVIRSGWMIVAVWIWFEKWSSLLWTKYQISEQYNKYCSSKRKY